MLKNKITDLLTIKYPIIQAPMAGGITTSQLVAAVSNHGGLGNIGAGYMSPQQLRDQISEIRELTANSFGVNLFVPNEFEASEDEIHRASSFLQPIREQLNVSETLSIEIPEPKNGFIAFKEQIEVVIDEKVSICSFTFGIPSSEVIDLLKQHNIILIGTATTVREAVEIEKIGMDMVVVQGSEAGGHRGNFLDGSQNSLVGLMSLIPQVVDRVNIPVIAAGGIMDGRGLLASLCLGAQAVQMGTAFLTCIESGAHNVYKEAILKSHEDQTVLTRAFSGKWARGINNQFIQNTEEHQHTFPEFPVQNTLTQSIRKAAASQNNQEFMSLWSGQSPRLAKIQTVESLIHQMIDEAEKIKV
ncbi:NAD(P)H-dependent flavin oxidoreductase [Neobacillus sp. LXY-4]|uniref:NAD(P)H-dependent flavin oxidoreductase n=1 Tax=Neobacillus sp. LXY-4 TaxID=3379826 RepID=UPI003EE33D4F